MRSSTASAIVGSPITSGQPSHGDLAGDEDGLASVTLLDDLQQVAPALGGEALQAPVVEDQQGDSAQAAHQAVECAFVAGAGERRHQLGHAAIEDGLVLAAGLVSEGAGDERLSRSRWPHPGSDCGPGGSSRRQRAG